MTFVALLTKELRLRLRRERSIWVIIIYLLVMGLLGLLFLSRQNGFSSYVLSQVGGQLYILLAAVQLVLILFITPAFTSTSINGEKDRQTFDLLLCSRLSAFSLVGGKLVAGLANALLLIAAAIPLFSLVFFFGGVSPAQFVKTTLVFIVTAIEVGTFGLFFSTILRRPQVSTAIAYMFCVIWLLVPWLLIILLSINPSFLGGNPGQTAIPWLFAWNPIVALISTLPIGGTSIGAFYLAGHAISPWRTYSIVSLIATVILFLLSMWFVKPNPIGRLRSLRRKQPPSTQNQTAVTA
ncbi:MAG TPA: ABC transporter permease [Ktedonobacteraceae bacterium]|nr:ABC transporter permease [Ktedonobacteraceae bacterium]